MTNSTAVGTAPYMQMWVGIDNHSLVAVSAYNMTIEVTDANIDEIKTRFEALFDQLAAEGGGQVLDQLTVDPHPSFPALIGVITVKDPEGTLVESVVHFLFKGSVEYVINCQYAPETKREIVAGCDEIVSTFQVTG